MRLDRWVGEALSSRVKAREAIAQVRVKVNGIAARDGALGVSEGDRVTLDGLAIGAREPLHLMLHKPSGCVTAREDAHLQTVFDLLPPGLRTEELSAVGRLDRDVTGLLLMTEDGQLAHRLISPRFEVEKIYRAEVNGRLTEADVLSMAEGVPLSDFTARPAKLTILEATDARSLALLTVHEGKFHQVKRMFAALQHPVETLHRQEVGGIPLDGSLAPGAYRKLTPEEIAHLYELTEMNP
jgi:16S rRNA pseudouridine516 synthase